MRHPDLPPDPVREAGFPTVEQLRQGILLDCITHSFWLPTHSDVLPLQMCWDGDTFFEDMMQGEHWAVSISNEGAVAAFYSNESTRNPFPDGTPPYDQSWYFRGMPARLNPIRDRALAQMHDFEFDIGNPAGAAITAAIWADGERFTAVEPWEEVYDHSLWVLHDFLTPPEEALQKWWQGMSFVDSHRDAAWSLFQRRLESTAPLILVEPGEWRVFLELADGNPNQAAMAEELLAPVGITLGDFPSRQSGT